MGQPATRLITITPLYYNMEEMTQEEVEAAISTLEKAKEVSDNNENYENMFALEKAKNILSVYHSE
jgi:hypothetical protein